MIGGEGSGTMGLAQAVSSIDQCIQFKLWRYKALRDYEHRCIKYASQLEQHLTATSGQPVLVNDWFYWFSFDVMGDLTMARSFNMLNDKTWHHVILMMRRFLALLGPITPVPWLARIAFNIPGATPGWGEFVRWCKIRVGERIEVGTSPLRWQFCFEENVLKLP